MSSRNDSEAPGGGQFDQFGDATRRTYLANERTYLAWWRTGVTALAAGVGIGRIVPGLAHQPRWPYAILGVGFAALGIVTILYSLRRQREVADSVKRGHFIHPDERVLIGLTISGAVLGLMVAIVVAISL